MAYRQILDSSDWWLAGLVALLFVAAPAQVWAQQTDSPSGDLDATPGAGADDDTDRKEASVESQLVFALSAYHAFPTRAELDDIADPSTITRLLRRFATSDETRPSMKTRAVDALGFYDDDTTREFLEEIIDRPESVGTSARVADLMRHHAITSLARAHGDAAVETLAPLLDADDFQIRMTTVVSLGKHGGARAHERLRELRRETDDRMMTRQIDKYVGQGPDEPRKKKDSDER
ncbi:MAG: HEAT repeat domain-containing protein [Myxococcota bacterium]